MKKWQSQVVREFEKFMQAFWVELPMVATQQLFGAGDRTILQQASWKAYDAFISLANEATNTFYANPAVGFLTGETMERALQIQHIGNAAVSALFGNLLPVGLPTANELAKLRAEIAALHKDLSRSVKAAENKEQAKQAVPRFAATTIEGPYDFCAGYLKRNHRADDEDAAA